MIPSLLWQLVPICLALSPLPRALAAHQQCRLRKSTKNNDIDSPENPSNPTVVPDPRPNSTASQTKTSAAASPSTTANTSRPFNYTTDTIRGVNLGGWFVLEPWITPSIFEDTNDATIIDEYTFGQKQNYNVALAALEHHWSTWITEDDFKEIKAAGLNHVRIPVGYWSVPLQASDTTYTLSVAPYIPGAWPHLLQALGWAKEHDLNVILDLHGAPGSQNGFDNSGQLTNSATWGTSPDNITRTLDIIRYISAHLSDMVDVIELLNEPKGFSGDPWPAVIRQFWSDGYDTVRKAAGNGIKVMIGDAFLTVQSWTDFLTYPRAQGVFMDYHEYQIFSPPELSRSFDDHINFACTLIPGLVSFAEANLFTVIGEWSTAPTDCAKWLNGRGVGARWDGTWFPQPGTQTFGSCDGWTGNATGFSQSYKTFLRKYFEVQVQIGEKVNGWVYWTWKTENAFEWNYQQGLAGGWIPSDPTDRIYPDLCS